MITRNAELFTRHMTWLLSLLSIVSSLSLSPVIAFCSCGSFCSVSTRVSRCAYYSIEVYGWLWFSHTIRDTDRDVAIPPYSYSHSQCIGICCVIVAAALAHMISVKFKILVSSRAVWPSQRHVTSPANTKYAQHDSESTRLERASSTIFGWN